MSATDDLTDAIEYVLPLDIGDDARRREIARLAANSAMSRGWRPPARVVSTVGELDALPQWTLIRSHIGELYERLAGKWDCLSEGGDAPLRTSAFVLRNQHQITVLWEPEGGEAP